MDFFYHDLLFNLLALGVEFFAFVALWLFIKRIYAVVLTVCKRHRAKNHEKRKKQEREAFYRRRATEYRREWLKCYRQE